jgi:hypothetical protein
MEIGYSVFTNLVFDLVTARPPPMTYIDCNRRLVTLLLLLEFSKALDNVRHSLLLRKLSLYLKFGGTAVALVSSYLSDRYQCVSVGGLLPELIAVTRGVVQGYVLGTLLFTIFHQRYGCLDRLLSI